MRKSDFKISQSGEKTSNHKKTVRIVRYKLRITRKKVSKFCDTNMESWEEKKHNCAISADSRLLGTLHKALSPAEGRGGVCDGVVGMKEWM